MNQIFKNKWFSQYGKILEHAYVTVDDVIGFFVDAI